MKESTLWKHLRPVFEKVGKFQKISDRFTPGVPDVLGKASCGAYAIELKELSGVRVLKAKFRPGQLDWLRDWEGAQGTSWILSTLGQRVYVHPWQFGEELEKGCDPSVVEKRALLTWTKNRSNTWNDFAKQLFSEAKPRSRS